MKFTIIGKKDLEIQKPNYKQTILHPLDPNILNKYPEFKLMFPGEKICYNCGNKIYENYLWGLQCPICGGIMILERKSPSHEKDETEVK